MKIELKTNPISDLIKSIIVGPGKNQDLIYDAIKHFVTTKFEDNGLGYTKGTNDGYTYEIIHGIEIRKSLTPFRG